MVTQRKFSYLTCRCITLGGRTVLFSLEVKGNQGSPEVNYLKACLPNTVSQGRGKWYYFSYVAYVVYELMNHIEFYGGQRQSEVTRGQY